MRTCHPIVIELEGRYLPSTVLHPQVRIAPFFQGNVPAPLAGAPLNHLYGTDQLYDTHHRLLTGAGQTIVNVEAGLPTNVNADMAAYCAREGLLFTPVTVLMAPGATPVVDPHGWGVEADLDVQVEHAIAPGARLLIVQAVSGFDQDMQAAVKYAASLRGTSIVNMSYGGSEDPSFLQDATYHPGHRVAFFAAGGDSGSTTPAGPRTVSSPAASSFVVSVGGTSPVATASGRYLGEQAWIGSGGGVAQVNPLPTYQRHYALAHPRQILTSGRNVPDVSAMAGPLPGYGIVDTDIPAPNGSTFRRVYGTSGASPLWCALTALADQDRVMRYHLPNLTAFDVLSAVYSAPAHDFHDITSGPANPAYAPRVGYDQVTGRGSPFAQRLEPWLAGAPHVPTPLALPFRAQGGNHLLHPFTQHEGDTTYEYPTDRS